MNLTILEKSQLGREALKKIPIPAAQNIVDCANQLIKVMNLFPNLHEDKQAAKSLDTLVDKIFSRKDQLSKEDVEVISNLFYSFHGFNSNHLESPLELLPVKNWIVRYPEANAILIGNQEYPIPLQILKEEKMASFKYFHTIPVLLEDGSSVYICQGFLAHFSEMMHSMLNSQMRNELSLTLNMLSHHEFDILIAFLEIGSSKLINEENVIALLMAGEYLQIPSIIKECKVFILQNTKLLDPKTIVNLLNHFGPNDIEAKALEVEISNFLNVNLSKNNLSKDFLEDLAYAKKNLKNPIVVSLANPDLKDADLEHLRGLSICSLKLIRCKNLTKYCMPIIASMPEIKALNIGGNDWVDDATLSQLPQTIEELTLTGCRFITKDGLASLNHSKVTKFEMICCRHLKDEDLALLPLQLQSIDLSSAVSIGDMTLKRLGQMNQLKYLVLSNTSITDKQVTFLPLELRSLILNGCPLSHEGCVHIGKMNGLENLVLSKAKIGDAELELFPHSLSKLSLNDCTQITDKGISSLAERKNLSFLELHRCSQISYKLIANLPPTLQIDFDSIPLSKMITYT